MRMEPAPRPALTLSRRRMLLGTIALTAAIGAAAGCDETKRVAEPLDGPDPGRSARPVTGPALRRRLDLSWLPPDYRVTGFGIDTNHEWVTGESTSNSHFTLRVELYRAGAKPEWDDEDWDTFVRAVGTERVGGQATQWAGRDGLGRRSPTVAVVWQHESGGEGVVTFTGSGPDNVATARRIAEGLRVDTGSAVLLPVTLRDAPVALRMRAVDAYDPGQEDTYLYRLRYAPGPRPTTSSTVELPVLEVRASPMSFAEQIVMSDPGQGPTSTMEGHPARRVTKAEPGDAYRDQLTLWEVNGLKLVISVSGQRIRDLVGSDAARAVFRSLAVYQQRVDWVPVPPLEG